MSTGFYVKNEPCKRSFDFVRNIEVTQRCARTRNYRVGSKTRSFFRIVTGEQKISRLSNLSGFWKEPGYSKESRFSKELEFGKGLATRINNSLKPTPSTLSRGHRSRTIVRAIPSVISFGLTIFRVSFCTCDKFYIDSVSFLVHVLMFGCICFKWRNKPVVFAYLVLNSW